METKTLALVTGANGHLGNNLVKHLLAKGIPVRASVRSFKNKAPLKGLDCEIVQADITDKQSLVRALKGVEVFYAVGAAFKLWAKDPKKELYDVNLLGTRNIVEAAKEAGVKRIVYVSSIAALNYQTLPAKESNGFNPDRRDWYYNSKNDGEQLAFQLAKENNIELVAVLPSAMIGSAALEPLSVSYNIIDLILKKQIPVETNITLNWIDVKDVAEGCYLAATKGSNGERYILANEKCTSIRETTQIARELFPEKNISLPVAVPKTLLYVIAGFMQLVSRINGKAPLLSVKDISMFSGLQQDFDTSKARTQLGFFPKSSGQAVKDAMLYLNERQKNTVKPLVKLAAMLLFCFSLVMPALAQDVVKGTAPNRYFISAESDPAFWVGTLGKHVAAIDVNIDARLAKHPRLRFGILGSSGRWGGDFGKTVLLTKDFTENNWTTQWNALGIEAQYQFRLGLTRGGFQTGMRAQWNQFIYYQNDVKKAVANHLTVVPQIGFQYFPFKKLGLYILPWAGIQVPVAGTIKINSDSQERNSRKLMPVVTAHLGWEFKF